MNIITKTRLETNLERIEQAANNALLATSASIIALNNSHSVLWSLPDEELVELLQYLLDSNKLNDLFLKHYNSAIALNSILDAGQLEGIRAISVVGREFVITNGVIELVIPPEPEPPVEDPPIVP